MTTQAQIREILLDSSTITVKPSCLLFLPMLRVLMINVEELVFFYHSGVQVSMIRDAFAEEMGLKKQAHNDSHC